MNIVYVITGLSLGGAETITVCLANEMRRRGHHVAILYLTGENWFKDRIDRDIIVQSLGLSKNPFSLLKAQLKAKQFLKVFSPQVVHGNMVHANIFVRLLRLHCHIPPLISTEHNKNIEGRLRMKIYQYTDFLSDINTNVSREATTYFIQQKAFGRNKSMTVYNGIDLVRFGRNEDKRLKIRTQYSVSNNEFLFLNVARLTPAKDHVNLLLAFKETCSICPDIKLLIVGDGELKKELEEKVKELKLINNVIFAGPHIHIEDYYSAADCFVLSSAWEGFGLVLAEAMAANLPVLTTDAGGCAEVVDDYEYVVPTHDPFLLADKMKKIVIMSPEEREQLGNTNKDKAKRFDINSIVKEWEDLYLGYLQ